MTATAVMKEAYALYRRLFLRSVGLAFVVFGVVHLLRGTLRSNGVLAAIFVIVLSLVGTSLVQGGLVEVVRGLHTDGRDVSLGDALNNAADRVLTLLVTSLIAGICAALALLLLVVPGLVLLTRWALLVPVVMLEGVGPLQALKRSSSIVKGHGWTVFGVLFRSGLLVGLVGFLFGAVAGTAGPVGWWVAVTLGSALTTPFAAHALTIVYYELTQPGQPVVRPEPPEGWQSVWQAEDAAPVPAAPSIDDEYERRFDELQRRWGQ